VVDEVMREKLRRTNPQACTLNPNCQTLWP